MMKRIGFLCCLSVACWLATAQAKENPFVQEMEEPPQAVIQNAEVRVAVTLPPQHEFTEDVPLEFDARLRSMKGLQVLKKAKLKRPARELPVRLRLPAIRQSEAVLEIRLNVPYCSVQPPKLCKYKSVKIIQPLLTRTDGKSKIELAVEIR